MNRAAQLVYYGIVTTREGPDLFFRYGPLGRPYIVPDVPTGNRLLKKRGRAAWSGYFAIPVVILSVNYGGDLWLGMSPPQYLPIALVGAAVVPWLFDWWMVSGELRRWERADRWHVQAYYLALARSHTFGELTRTPALNAVLGAALVYMLALHFKAYLAAYMAAAGFGAHVLSRAYAVLLKRRDITAES